MTSVAETRRRIHQSVERLADLSLDMARLVDAIGDQRAGYPAKASGASPEGMGSPSPWCWTHERDVAECRRLDPDATCTGSPKRATSDPTGEAATSPDRAAGDLVELKRHLARVEHDVAEAYRIHQRYLAVAAPEPDAPGCDLCARVLDSRKRPSWAKTHVKGYTVDGSPRRLCRWCYDFVREAERAPTVGECEVHLAGHYVPKSKTPPASIDETGGRVGRAVRRRNQNQRGVA